MLLRHCLVVSGVAAAVALTAVPATAASAPSTPDTPVPAPTTSSAPAVPTVVRGPEGVCFTVVKEKGAVRVVRKAAPKSKQEAVECKRALQNALGVAVPQGAPETGGGGMAAEVSSWN